MSTVGGPICLYRAHFNSFEKPERALGLARSDTPINAAGLDVVYPAYVLPPTLRE